MFKFVFAALMCVALSCPTMVSAQNCGCCDPAPCTKTRKKLALVDVQKERCRLKMACVTDECGCTSRKLVRVKECVTRKSLRLVDVPVDPCKKSCRLSLKDRMCAMKAKMQSAMSGPCCDAAAPCCDAAPAPAPCCDAAPAPVMAAPAPCCN